MMIRFLLLLLVPALLVDGQEVRRRRPMSYVRRAMVKGSSVTLVEEKMEETEVSISLFLATLVLVAALGLMVRFSAPFFQLNTYWKRKLQFSLSSGPIPLADDDGFGNGGLVPVPLEADDDGFGGPTEISGKAGKAGVGKAGKAGKGGVGKAELGKTGKAGKAKLGKAGGQTPLEPLDVDDDGFVYPSEIFGKAGKAGVGKAGKAGIGKAGVGKAGKAGGLSSFPSAGPSVSASAVPSGSSSVAPSGSPSAGPSASPTAGIVLPPLEPLEVDDDGFGLPSEFSGKAGKAGVGKAGKAGKAGVGKAGKAGGLGAFPSAGPRASPSAVPSVSSSAAPSTSPSAGPSKGGFVTASEAGVGKAGKGGVGKAGGKGTSPPTGSPPTGPISLIVLDDDDFFITAP
jgi:hypothetical protein